MFGLQLINPPKTVFKEMKYHIKPMKKRYFQDKMSIFVKVMFMPALNTSFELLPRCLDFDMIFTFCGNDLYMLYIALRHGREPVGGDGKSLAQIEDDMEPWTSRSYSTDLASRRRPRPPIPDAGLQDSGHRRLKGMF